MAGAYRAPIVEDKPSIPSVVPMRRGRPTKPDFEPRDPKPSPSPMRVVTSDPFVALDANSSSTSTKVVTDDISSRFPPLEDFSILQEPKGKFSFDDPQPETMAKAPKDISQRVTDALADDAFARPAGSDKATSMQPKQAIPAILLDEETQDMSEPPKPKAIHFPSSPKEDGRKPSMVSTGTMTSPSPPSSSHNNSNSPRPIFRFPASEHRSSSQSQGSDNSGQITSSLRPDGSAKRPGLLDYRSKSQTSTLSVSKSPVSSRPSLEGSRPSQLDLKSASISRSKSASSRSRPISIQAEPRRNFLHSREMSAGDTPSSDSLNRTYRAEYLPSALSDEPEDAMETNKIQSNVAFLRAMEDEDISKRKEKRLSSGSRHVKRASMPSISLSGTKSLLAGRFGDAFRRFEANTGGPGRRSPSPPERHGRDLTPIAGSEATDGRSDDGHVLEETEAIPPEVRRELERRRLSQEEKRVSDAAAAYKQKFSRKSDEGQEPYKEKQANSRAASIQSKVKSLLDESGRASPVRVKHGYSPYPQSPSHYPTQAPRQILASPDGFRQSNASQVPGNPPTNSQASRPPKKADSMPKSPVVNTKQPPLATASTRTQNSVQLPASDSRYPPPTGAASAPTANRPFTRPNAPPKPQALRTGNRELERPSSSSSRQNLIAHALPSSAVGNISPESEDWEEKFSKRYPSLAGLELVETDVGSGRGER